MQKWLEISGHFCISPSSLRSVKHGATKISANPYSLALTGGIACGKSTVAAILASEGLQRVDADQIARDVVEPGTVGLQRVVERFGRGVLRSDGTLDRRELGRQVFACALSRQDLEALLHPLIWERMYASMTAAATDKSETVFEIPLLFENDHQDRFSTVWVVTAQREVQLQRLIQRDGWSRSEAEARLASQMSVEEKARRATYVIDNNGDELALRDQLLTGLKRWRAARA